MKALVVHGAGDLRFDDLPEPIPRRDRCWSATPTVVSADRTCTTTSTAPSVPSPYENHWCSVMKSSVESRATPPVSWPPGPRWPSTRPPLWALPRMLGRCPQRVPQRPLFRLRGQLPAHSGRVLRIYGRPPGSDSGTAGHTPPVQGCAGEPLAVGLHALSRAGGVSGAKVLVGGSGPIGVLAAGAAKAAGAAEVWTTTCWITR